MHNYSINNDTKLKVFFLLVMASLLLLSLLEWMAPFLHQLNVFISIPSAFAIYGLLYILFSKYLWQSKILNLLGLVQTPIINGKWSGILKSSVNNFKQEYPITIDIHQTWDKISIYLEGETKESESTMAGFRVINPSKSELEWGFLSKDKPEYRKQDDYIVCGIAKVTLNMTKQNKTSNRLSGSYYTEQGSDTNGSISLTRER
jgi:hypothetical protein